VRGVLRRAQGPCDRAVRSPVRVCEACAEQLTKTRTPMCPVCRGPILQTMKVFCS
jgi:predicted amidophosphoribosyltransferase